MSNPCRLPASAAALKQNLPLTGRVTGRPIRLTAWVALAVAASAPAAVIAGAKKSAVHVQVDGTTLTGEVRATTVGGALEELGIKRGELDRTQPGLAAQLPKGKPIVVTRVERRVETTTESLPYGREFEYSDKLRAGTRKTTRPGIEGQKECVFEVWYRNGKETLRKPVRERVVREPANEVVLIGARHSFASRGMPRPRKVLVMEATAYTPGPESCGKYANGWTACGVRAQYGVIAVDPRIIPFGTRVYVEGYGYAIAADTGSAIKGMRIDLCLPTVKKALAVGRRKVKVYLLD